MFTRLKLELFHAAGSITLLKAMVFRDQTPTEWRFWLVQSLTWRRIIKTLKLFQFLLFVMPVHHLLMEMCNLITIYLRSIPQGWQHFEKWLLWEGADNKKIATRMNYHDQEWERCVRPSRKSCRDTGSGCFGPSLSELLAANDPKKHRTRLKLV